MRPFPYRLVTIDLDGTLTRVHGWRRMAEAFGRSGEFEESNRRFFAREISEGTHLHNLLGVARGRTREEIEQVLDATPKVDGIRETLDALRSAGARVALLTHNPEYVCDWYTDRFGFDAAEGTNGTVWRGSRLADPGPARADKLGGLRRLEERWNLRGREVAHVGDGWADAALFPYVGAGIAFNSSLADVEARADAVVRAASLRAIVPVLSGLVPRAPVNDGPPAGDNSNTSTRV